MKKNRFFASLLAIVLLFTMVVPTTVLAADGLPRPGDHMRDREPGMYLVGSGFHGARIIVMPGSYDGLDSFEFIIDGNSLEFYGEAVLLYSDGYRVYPIHEIFADGERLTFFYDTSRRVDSEIFVQFREVTGGTDSAMRTFFNGRLASGHHYDSSISNRSPYQLSRPIGVGSVRDIFTMTNVTADSHTIPHLRVPRPSVLPTTPQAPIMGLAVNQSTTTSPPPTNFIDVSATHWARIHIDSVAHKGLMQGVGGNRFDPYGILTRAQVAQILFNAYSTRLPAGTTSFADVSSGAWYAAAANWAGYHQLIVPRGAVDFRPHDPAPRQLVAEALHRMASGLGVTMPTVRDPVTFTDQGAITHLAAVHALQQAGIISGFPDGSFGPERTITRAEMATLIDRYTNISGLEP